MGELTGISEEEKSKRGEKEYNLNAIRLILVVKGTIEVLARFNANTSLEDLSVQVSFLYPSGVREDTLDHRPFG